MWTDGSAFTSEDGISHAGSGVFYGYQNPRNRALSTPGEQTNIRAELYAFLHVLRTEHRACVVYSDCRYVVDGVNIYRKKWRSRAWMEKPLAGKYVAHADMWRDIDALLARRDNTAGCEVRWTKGHPLPMHMHPGQTTEIEAYGNVGADYLAGVASSSTDPRERESAQQRANAPLTHRK